MMDPITPAGGRLYLAVSEGNVTSPYGGITVDPMNTGCTFDAGGRPCSAVVPGVYYLRFSQRTRSAALDVEMNNTATWTLATDVGVQSVRVRNMRSFETGFCDDYWNWSYWIANAR
jgi:hypothetical protein